MRAPEYWSEQGIYRFAKEWIDPGTRGRLAPSTFVDLGQYLLERISDLGIEPGWETALRFSMLDLALGLPGDMLTKVDRMSMAHSLEVRVPLCDHRLVEYFGTLPAGVRRQGMQGKRFLKRAFREELEPVIGQRKRGFGIPLGQWLERAKPDVSRIVLSRRAFVREWVDAGFLATLLRADLVDDLMARYAVWATLVLEVFCVVYLDGDGLRPAFGLKDLADDRG
jgi:asparagine synthetase B (glutamine-hydrolysing)